ncbi:valine--tRNA ligase [Shimia ponticola]|uniref:valine--tRNA ligase n=1 Tax=Shimia ponticola TaxID=2582893 RepID=UPI0011BD821B|nr:valine--tRNA ligase [Shimia ponticola]
MPMEKTFNASEAETRLFEAWQAAGCFKAGANAKPEASTYCIMIPPPNVTGVLHVGHAFNNTLQDILIRWHRMRGFDTLWQPGTDHAGIATQMVVERELAKNQEPSRTELGREKFLEKVWEWKAQSGGTIINQLKRLGASCDFDRTAFTMSGAPGAPADEAGGNFHDAVIKVFVEMYSKGLIYRGKRLVNWDPHFETAISDLEVENTEVAGHMWHFKYPLAGGATYTYVEKDEDGNVILEEERDYISIATTRPETMLGDGAVAVHPSDERYSPIVGQLCEIPVGPKEHRRLIPIITDEYPDPDFGSGAVKITGAHDFNDYGVATRNDIPLYRLMDTKAAMRADGLSYEDSATKAGELARAKAAGAVDMPSEAEIDQINLVPDEYRGLDRMEAREKIVAAITAEGLAVMTTEDDARLGGKRPKTAEGETAAAVPLVEAKLIMQPFGDRSKVVIEPMLTDQWFVDTAKIVEPALDAVRTGRTTIIPESDRKVYFHWLENIEPWCVSRQLWWGHQIPVWYGLDLTGKTFRDDEGDGALDLVEMMRLLAAQAIPPGDEAFHCAASFDDAAPKFNDVLADLPTPLNHARVIEVDSRDDALAALAQSLAEYEVSQDPTGLVYPVWRDPDVLDTWFSSGLWPIGTLGWPEDTPELAKYFPTNDLITGQDILFFWVARMMMMQLAVVDEVPFTNVYLHGLVRDAKGKKMSKSTGNVIDPLEIIDEYGADALRFSSAAMAALGGVLKLDVQRIAGYRNFGTKIWNAHRFAEMNGVFDIDTPALPTATATANRWIIGETARVLQTVDEALKAYRFNDAAQALYAFVWGKVCDWYVEFAKPLFADDATKQETQETMAWVLDQCLILLHPMMPFITEELWGNRSRSNMLAVTDWPSYTTALIDPAADTEMNWTITLIENIRSARAQMNVPASAQIPLVQTQADPVAENALKTNWSLISRMARIEALSVADDMPKGAVTVAAPGATFGLPLADIIDVAAEHARLTKSLAKLDKEIKGLESRVNNPKFAASAPPEVVEEARGNLADRNEERSKLQDALDRLAEVN